MEAQVQYYENKLAYEIDAADLFETLNNQKDWVVVDARQAFGYEKEHIPGAISLPHSTMNETTVAHLDRSKTYVCDCDGIGCNASTKGALKLTRLGFKTKELIGGIHWWKQDGYATAGQQPTQGSTVQCAC